MNSYLKPIILYFLSSFSDLCLLNIFYVLERKQKLQQLMKAPERHVYLEYNYQGFTNKILKGD